jgi:hypothetical protein
MEIGVLIKGFRLDSDEESRRSKPISDVKGLKDETYFPGSLQTSGAITPTPPFCLIF